MDKKIDIEYSWNRNILLIQWLLFIMLIFFGLYSTGNNGIKNYNGLFLVVICLGVFNAGITYKSYLFFKNRYAISSLFFIDIIIISLTVYFTRGLDSDLYLAYFLIIFMAALSNSIVNSIVISIVISFVYGALLFKNRQTVAFLEPSILIRLPFFYVISIFSSFWVEQIQYHKKKAEYMHKISLELNNKNYMINNEILNLKNLITDLQQDLNIRIMEKNLYLKRAVYSEKIMQEILRESYNLIFILNEKGFIAVTNDKVPLALGYHDENLIGRSMLDMVSTEDKNKLKNIFSLLDKKISVKEKLSFENAFGKILFLDINFFPMQDYYGIQQILCIAHPAKEINN